MAQRTSAGQIRWVFNGLWLLICRIGRHFSRCRGIYGFLAGWVSAILMLAAVFWYGILAFPLPWKVIDPADPRFDVTKFRLTDYQHSVPTYIVKEALFPSSFEVEDVAEYIAEFEKRKKYRKKKEVNLRESLENLLPIGSNKAKVDEILVSYGGAVSVEMDGKHPSIKEENYKEYSYSLMPLFAYIESMLYGYPPDEFDIQIFVVYSADDKIVTASFHDNFGEFFETKSANPPR